MGRAGTRRWRTFRRLRFECWLTASTTPKLPRTLSARPSKRRDDVARDQGTAHARSVAAYRLDHQTGSRLTPDLSTRGLAQLRLRFSRQRRGRAQDAIADREAYGVDA